MLKQDLPLRPGPCAFSEPRLFDAGDLTELDFRLGAAMADTARAA